MKKIIFIIMSLILAGCGSTNFSYVDDDMKASGLNDGGYVIASMVNDTDGNDVSPFTRAKLHFRNIDTGEKGYLGIIKPDIIYKNDEDIIVSGKVGHSIAMLLKPGNYEFYSFTFDFDLGTILNTWQPKKEFSIPFTVYKGKTICIGEFNTKAEWGKNIVGFPVIIGGYFELTNQSERDIALVTKKIPTLPKKCTYYPLVVQQNTNGLFVNHF